MVRNSIGVVILALWAASAPAQCKTCYGDYNVQLGYYGSRNCFPANQCGGPPSSTSENLLGAETPGVVLVQHGGKYLVSAVLEDSPARLAGILVDDEIVSLNGRTLGAEECSSGWADAEGFATFLIRRGSQEMRMHVATAPLLSMFGSHVAVSSWEARRSIAFRAPFTLGLQWTEARSGDLEVTQVLAGSPADAAGLTVGEHIVSVNGISLTTGGTINLELSDGYEPRTVIVETSYGFVHRRTMLRSRGIAEILMFPAPRRRQTRVEQAGLKNIETLSIQK